MTHTYLAGAHWRGSPGEWREDDLIAAHRSGRIAPDAIYSTGQYVGSRREITTPYGFAVITAPFSPPGDFRDPDHEIYGPFDSIDDVHLPPHATAGSWIALTHEPRTVGEIAAWVANGKDADEPQSTEPEPELHTGPELHADPKPQAEMSHLGSEANPIQRSALTQNILFALLGFGFCALIYVYVFD